MSTTKWIIENSFYISASTSILDPTEAGLQPPAPTGHTLMIWFSGCNYSCPLGGRKRPPRLVGFIEVSSLSSSVAVSCLAQIFHLTLIILEFWMLIEFRHHLLGLIPPTCTILFLLNSYLTFSHKKLFLLFMILSCAVWLGKFSPCSCSLTWISIQKLMKGVAANMINNLYYSKLLSHTVHIIWKIIIFWDFIIFTVTVIFLKQNCFLKATQIFGCLAWANITQ